MPDPSKLAWLDLETTDSDENLPSSAVIEVGIVFTDFALNPLMSTQLVVNPALSMAQDPTNADEVARILQHLWESMDPVVKAMHTANGLWDDVAKSEYSTEAADQALVEIFQEVVSDGSLIGLGGSGVGHFDLKYLRKFMPRSTSLLTHYVYDVGVVRRFLRDLCGLDVTAADLEGKSSGEGKTHRAVDDAWAHLNEARFYVEKFKDQVRL